MINVFVYGTLKEGGKFHHCIQQPHVKKKDIGILFHEEFTLFVPKQDGGYPYLVNEYSDLPCTGEIYSMPKIVMTEVLDVLEGYPHHYNRTVLQVETKEGKVPCWVYYVEEVDDIIEKHFIPSNTFDQTK